MCLEKSSETKTGVTLATLAVSQEADAIGVGKCTFYCYLGREQPTGQGRPTTEKLVRCIHGSQESEPLGEAPGAGRWQMVGEEKVGRNLSSGFCGKNQVRQGKQA